jgi:hypothetical protein
VLPSILAGLLTFTTQGDLAWWIDAFPGKDFACLLSKLMLCR